MSGLVNREEVHVTILLRHELREEDLRELIADRALAIRIENYYPVDRCERVADLLVNSPLFGMYVNATAIGRVGQAFFESQANEQSRRRYEEDAIKWIRELRRLCSPDLTPIDKFRLELDEAWAAGARVAALNAKKMFVGLARHFGQGSEAEPHQDVFAWDAPGSPEAAALAGQLAMNVYLSLPRSGGELTLWDMRLSQEEYETRRIPNSYGVRRDTLGPPAAAIRPKQGELILFNAGRVHAVEKVEVGSRATWTCFVGFGQADQPLVLWS
jgi:2OG-Fe(II) oxygenase superfamily